MNPVSLLDDVLALAVKHPAIARLARSLDEQPLDPEQALLVLRQIGELARLGRFGTLALLLKADAQRHAGASGQWTPWERHERFTAAPHDQSPAIDDDECAALILEQCALSCHLLGHQDVAALGARYEHERAMLDQGTPAERQAFREDKRAWHHEEVQLDWLLVLRQQLVDELQWTRANYLSVVGDVLVEYVEAAHRVALMRYRVALDDPTLTAQELALLLREDLDDAGGGQEGGNRRITIAIEPELRRALVDTVQSVQGDRATLQRLAALWSQSQARLMNDDDRKLATLLFRRLARMIHPDVIESHPDFGSMTEANRRRLREIWDQSSATHGTRAFLSQARLINYVEHLRAWTAEVERILRCPTFHAPARLLSGESLQERHTDLRRAMADVRRYLHAVRSEIAALEFAPEHEYYRRVMAMTDAEKEVERAQMMDRVQRWNLEARRLAGQLNDRNRSGPDTNKPDEDTP